MELLSLPRAGLWVRALFQPPAGLIPSPARGANTANPCIYFSCLVSSQFQSTEVLHCSIWFCGISSPAGSRRHSKFRDGKKIMDLVRFHLPAKLAKPGMPGEPCCGRSIPGPHLFRPLPAFHSLLIPNHPLIPKSLSGHCTKPDPAVGAGTGQIIQSLNLFHLFLWLRIVREQMAIFSSVSVIRSHSLRQRWLRQIPGPLQSHHLVFPSAQPLPSAWARLPPACRREVGRQEGR